MQEYEHIKPVHAPAGEVFDFLSEVGNLPHYLPPVKDAGLRALIPTL